MTALSLCSSFFCCFLMVCRSTRKAPCDPAIAISCAPSAVYCVATEVNIRAGRPCFHSCSAGSTPSRHPLAPRGHCRADGVIRTRNSKKQKKGERRPCCLFERSFSSPGCMPASVEPFIILLWGTFYLLLAASQQFTSNRTIVRSIRDFFFSSLFLLKRVAK